MLHQDTSQKAFCKKIKNKAFLVTEGHAKMIIVKFFNDLSNKFGGFLSKIIHATGMPIHIIIRKCYFVILLFKIVAQGDYCYRVESVRKCICSRSPTPMDSKVHNFFLEATIDYFLLSCTPWNVGLKIRQIGSHFTMFQILLLMLTFPWPGPKAYSKMLIFSKS